MEILRMLLLPTILIGFLFFTSCQKSSITQTITLETDTYISSQDPANHSESNQLSIAKNSTLEEKAIVKLPTGDSTKEFSADDDILLMVLALPLFILKRLLNCETDLITPSNLQSSLLTFNVSSTSESSLDGKLTLALLAKPSWHTANWVQAHPFSESGVWTLPGGDTDPAFTNVTNTTSSGTVQFDITTYFKHLMSTANATHSGFLIQSKTDTLQSTTLKSTQAGITTERPRLISVYTGYCPNFNSVNTYDLSYILGREPVQLVRQLD